MNKLYYKKFSIAAISLCFVALLPAMAQGEIRRGGARGAAAGAAIGAIAGDAGKGAAIGATAGGLKRGFQKLDSKKTAQSQAAVSSPAQDAYNRAIGACLSGRGYSVN